MTKYNLLPYFFNRVIIKNPRIVLICLFLAVVLLGFGIKYFRLDASAETLVLENDQDLKYARLIDSRYGGGDFLVVIFEPKDDLFSDRTLGTLAHLRNDLKQVSNVESVLTILDVPLLESPPIPLKEIGSITRTLESPDVDRALARKELKESPLYNDLLVSPDLKTTAILITFPNDFRYKELIERRNVLREKSAAGSLTPAEQVELKSVVRQFAQYHDKVRQERHTNILAIRKIMDQYKQDDALFLGGISMIADDMISFIKNDLRFFGSAVFLLLVLTIAVIFRRTYWVLLPTLTCLVSVVCTVGFLGWLGWEVTVISSNFISLQLIITLAMTIHLMVRYRELALEQPQASQHKLILKTITAMWRPCVYSGLTTLMGFASLIFTNIRPIINFGYIMVVGVLTPMLGRFTISHGKLILVASAVLLVVNVLGIRKLQVENCFINYFKSATEIHRGMKVLDQQLGGTTPLDVVIDFGQTAPSEEASSNTAAKTEDVFDEFGEIETDSQKTKQKYWFTPRKMASIAAVHDYLDNLPETGKVLSVVTLVRMIERLNGGKSLDNVELAVLFDKIPDRLRQILVNSYVSVENNQVRITVRIKDSMPSLNRNELLKKIQTDLTGKLGFKPNEVRLAGTLVLYNNMLQSLYTSQVVTMGFATLALMGTFLVLFRSLRIAVIAIFPNLLAISCVLGVMGWLHIPLDMMTITIAAIGVGLADDDTIHYIHRFKHEVESSGSYVEALHRSHDSIGHAIYYTTVTLVIGFSILCFSNFIPTIYFGLLTVLAITVALLASLTLLPQLLVLIKPYGKKPKAKHDDEEIIL
jgi:predicted RND superfamily exporter protein